MIYKQKVTLKTKLEIKNHKTKELMNVITSKIIITLQ